ncbi:hypothetical protein Nepgr_022586 [Nepenthes gracilis]|uniref:Uncharacterized protein n=1 Tax=Nepenthes gracilis TaxID=150966 RepID=A0AAD3XY82_NEPGR|nr:hypothetical protein Nepgr_022586 [Nepenthes gracilis]
MFLHLNFERFYNPTAPSTTQANVSRVCHHLSSNAASPMAASHQQANASISSHLQQGVHFLQQTPKHQPLEGTHVLQKVKFKNNFKEAHKHHNRSTTQRLL